MWHEKEILVPFAFFLKENCFFKESKVKVLYLWPVWNLPSHEVKQRLLR